MDQAENQAAKEILALATNAFERGAYGLAQTLLAPLLVAGSGRPPVGVLCLRARLALVQGDTAATDWLAQALQQAPQELKLRHQLAELYRAGNRPDAAVALYRAGLTEAPAEQQAEIHHSLGNLLLAQAAYAEALEQFQAVLAKRPDAIESHFSLGQLYRRIGEPAAAQTAFETVTKLAPAFPWGWFARGGVAADRGDWQTARCCYERALQLAPDWDAAWLELAVVCQHAGQWRPALQAARQLARLRPGQAEAANLVGSLELTCGDPQAAEASFRQALAFEADHAAAWNNLALACLQQRRLAEALIASEQAVKRAPQQPAFWQTLGTIQEQSLQPEQARRAWRRALQLAPDPGLEVRLALLLPGLYTETAEIQASRDGFEAGLDRLLASGLRLSDPHAQVGSMPFYLLYQHLPVRRTLEKLAQFYLQACPALDWVAPACRVARPLPTRWRIGFISHFFRRHSIGQMFRGLIEAFDRQRFEVTLFTFAPAEDAVAAALQQAADRTVILSPGLFEARRQIAAAEQDLLFYTDIGMSSLSYFLAFARLAPLQYVTWGHGITTGLSRLDGYVSSHALETPASRQDYTEPLLLTQRLFPCFSPPQRPAETRAKGRSDFDLPAEAHLYVCPQSGFKLQPVFDELLAGLLRGDPAGLIVLLEGYHPAMTEFLRRRFRRHFPDVAERVRFLPRQPVADYLQLVALSDVQLDPFPIGGGNTTYDTLQLGTPLVTLEGSRSSSRLTAACLRQIGMLRTITATPAAYLALALRLGTDPDFRAEVAAEQAAKAPLLYHDHAAVRELEELLIGWSRDHWPAAGAKPD